MSCHEHCKDDLRKLSLTYLIKPRNRRVQIFLPINSFTFPCFMFNTSTIDHFPPRPASDLMHRHYLLVETHLGATFIQRLARGYSRESLLQRMSVLRGRYPVILSSRHTRTLPRPAELVELR